MSDENAQVLEEQLKHGLALYEWLSLAPFCVFTLCSHGYKQHKMAAVNVPSFERKTERKTCIGFTWSQTPGSLPPPVVTTAL